MPASVSIRSPPSSTTDYDKGPPVDSEAVSVSDTDMPDITELTTCRRREKNTLNIREMESEITASGDLTAEDRELMAILKKADTNKDGVLTVHEALKVFRDDAKSHRDLKMKRRLLFGAAVVSLILLLGNGLLIALVTAIYKDTYVKGDTTLANANGNVVGTRAATHNLPLLVAPVLPDDELFSVETIRFKLPGTTVGPNEAGSGEANGEVDPSVLNSVRIARVEKVNRTAVVFYGTGGEQVRVWNGVTTVHLSDNGAEIPVCSADITCAAFQVEGAELAEKYLAEAEALLAPFEVGRRRLAHKNKHKPRRDGKKYQC